MPSRAELREALRRVPMQRVRSSAIEKFGYEPRLRMAAVQFAGGGTVYGYPDLSDDEVRGLLEVLEHHESLGHYVATVIKPNHDHERVQL
jgi:hypothetical protein